MELIAQILAIVISATLLIYVYAKDPKREPLKVVFKVFVFGILSVLPSMFLGILLNYFFADMAFSQRLSYSIIDSFLFTGLIEEFFKWAVLMLFVWNHNDFNDTFDGIVYSVWVSLGFAMLENAFYIYSSGIKMAFMRAFFVGHFVFGIFMGYYLSRARCAFYSNDKRNKRKYLIYSLLIPVIPHGLYDFLLDRSFVYLMFFSVFYLVIIFFAFKLVKHEAVNDHCLKN